MSKTFKHTVFVVNTFGAFFMVRTNNAQIDIETLKNGGCGIFDSLPALYANVSKNDGLEISDIEDKEIVIEILDLDPEYWVELDDRGLVSAIELECDQTIELYIIGYEV